VKGFPTIPRMPPNFNIVLNLGFSKKLMKKWFNNQKFHTVASNILNQVVAPLFTENFLMISSIT
jgi:hypothetical protein